MNLLLTDFLYKYVFMKHGIWYMYSTWKSHILLHYYINALQVQEMRKDNQQRSENLAEDITDLLKTNISLKEDVPVEVNPRGLIFCLKYY